MFHPESSNHIICSEKMSLQIYFSDFTHHLGHVEQLELKRARREHVVMEVLNARNGTVKM